MVQIALTLMNVRQLRWHTSTSVIKTPAVAILMDHLSALVCRCILEMGKIAQILTNVRLTLITVMKTAIVLTRTALSCAGVDQDLVEMAHFVQM